MAASTSIREIARYALLHLRRSPAAAGSPLAPIVSLTTIPSRIGRLRPALNSLQDQTLRPARIYLALPAYSRREERPYAVPEWLRRHPLVTILASPKDWGPATKLIPALRRHENDPDRAILAVDDDNVYPRRFIETFARYARELPDAALSLRGWPMPESLRWQESREFTGAQITAPVETDVITGCGGVLVRPRFFDPAFFDYAPAPPQAFFVDDIWISGHLARKGIRKYVIPLAEGHVYLPSLAVLFGPALDRTANKTGLNNDTVIDYFRADWRLPSRGTDGEGKAGLTR